LAEEPAPIDFLALYIPANPFSSLASTAVPAIVVFSVLVGVALIGVQQKGSLLDALSSIVEALMRVTGFVVKLAPLGIFALTASAAGSIDIEELRRLQIFPVCYIVLSLILSFWILPGLVTTVTSLRYVDIIRSLRTPLITAFATGNLLIVLPMLVEQSKELLAATAETDGSRTGEANAFVDVLVPTSFNFPNLAALLALSFVLFAGWYIGAPVSVADYPMVSLAGLVSLFGKTVLAIPFLLDLLRLPSDLFQLFLTADVLGSRFGSLVAVMHIFVIAVIGASALARTVQLRPVALLRFSIISVVLVAGGLLGVRMFYTHVLVAPYTKDQALTGLRLLREPHDRVTVFKTPPAGADGKSSSYSEIRHRGTLRVCYTPDLFPTSFFNAAGELVGFDIEMAHNLARRLDLGLELRPVDDIRNYPDRLNSGYCDIGMTALGIVPESVGLVAMTVPITNFSVGFIVRDHLRDDFATWDKIQNRDNLRLAAVDTASARKFLRTRLPRATQVPLRREGEFKRLLESRTDEFDAVVTAAERGAAWTVLYPHFTMVVPRPVVSVPVGYSIQNERHKLLRVVNAWLHEAKRTGEIDNLHKYWVQGRTKEVEPPRWSIIRNVLHWVE
jgi:ABC-type amino acid transport substrate-binding protein